MPGETNSDLSRALTQLTISRLWQEAGLPGHCSERDEIVKSPFREDRNPSFSIGGGGKVFKDWGKPEHAGGLIDFARLAWPSKSEADIKDLLVDIAGTRTHKPAAAAPAAPGAAAAAVEIPPVILRAAKSIEKRQRAAEAEERIYREHEDQLGVKLDPERKDVPEWPDCVRDRYLAGVADLRADGKAIEKLAKARGWPFFWIEELLAGEQLAYVWERGCDPGARWASRQKAFRVDFPVISVDEHGARAELKPVGYHQRFFMPAAAGAEPKKGWMYLPGFPKFAPRSEYEQAIIAAGLGRGLKWEPAARDAGGLRDKFIPPLPFVLGDLVNTRTIVILEGQWDAISFFGACGWFHDTAAPAGVAVFGIRGADGMNPFLGYWGRWLLANAPRAWVIADNDNAGRAWRERPAAKEGALQPPSLADRLQHAGCRDVKISWLKPGPWGKDFNDYYKTARPDAAAMHRWAKKAGVLTGAGGWA